MIASLERIRIVIEKLRAIRFAQAKNPRRLINPYLITLHKPPRQFPSGKCSARVINQHKAGLVETADQILADRALIRCFAANAAVDLARRAGGYTGRTAAALDNRGANPVRSTILRRRLAAPMPLSDRFDALGEQASQSPFSNWRQLLLTSPARSFSR